MGRQNRGQSHDKHTESVQDDEVPGESGLTHRKRTEIPVKHKLRSKGTYHGHDRPQSERKAQSESPPLFVYASGKDFPFEEGDGAQKPAHQSCAHDQGRDKPVRGRLEQADHHKQSAGRNHGVGGDQDRLEHSHLAKVPSEQHQKRRGRPQIGRGWKVGNLVGIAHRV